MGKVASRWRRTPDGGGSLPRLGFSVCVETPIFPEVSTERFCAGDRMGKKASTLTPELLHAQVKERSEADQRERTQEAGRSEDQHNCTMSQSFIIGLGLHFYPDLHFFNPFFAAGALIFYHVYATPSSPFTQCI